MSGKRVAIIGAGLTGSLLSIFLARRGYEVCLYEKRSDIRKSRPDKKRTIAMSMAYRGWKALRAAGLESSLRRLATPTYGRITYMRTGENFRQLYGNDDQAIDTIDRKSLNAMLIETAQENGSCRVCFDSAVVAIDFVRRTMDVECNGETNNTTYDYLFATDGVFSRGRQEFERFSGLAPQIKQLSIGYKEFTIPYAAVASLAWEKSFVHVLPTETANFVALPSDDKQAFMGNLFCQNDWVEFFNGSPSKQNVIDLLGPKFPLLRGILEQLDEPSFDDASANIYTTQCDQWNYEGSFLMIGDSVHAMAPFYAMGMNMCFEDCLVLDDLLTVNNGDLDQTVRDYQVCRKSDVDSMQRLAWQNFRTLSKSSEAWFNQEWGLDQMLSQYCPDHWASESALVSFHGLPISEVEPRIARQKRFIVEHGLSCDNLASMEETEILALCDQIKSSLAPYDLADSSL